MSTIGLMRDKASRQRPTAAVDSEGNTSTAESAAVAVWGTWGAPAAADLESASRRAMKLDATFAFNSPAFDIAIGDRLTVRGLIYNVVDVIDARVHKRAMLRYIG